MARKPTKGASEHGGAVMASGSHLTEGSIGGPPKKKKGSNTTNQSSIVPREDEAPTASMYFPPPSQSLDISSKKKENHGDSNSAGSKRSRNGSNQPMADQTIEGDKQKRGDGQDFKTDDRDQRRWSRYPIEKHASTVYTKNLFYEFSKEFEKTAEYDVEPEGQLQFWLVPNSNYVYGYGKRTYLVTTLEDEGSYYCECSKFDRDGMICCHIMKILTRLGVKAIPERYILKSWTQEAVPNSEIAGANAHLPADFIARGMPLNNRKTLWFTNLSIAFATLAVEGCVSKETYNLVDSHIKIMCSKLDEIKKRRPGRKKVRANPEPSGVANVSIVAHDIADGIHGVVAPAAEVHSGPSSEVSVSTTAILPAIQADDAVGNHYMPSAGAMMNTVANPPRSKVKGRKKEKRLKKGMNAEAKRKNKCSICKSTDHNAARCLEKVDEKLTESEGAAV
ncbi:hypothetical protein C2845_PM03G29830 [Panicum miliaceum]|uniref:SWIM-type domain-containing protein n=1 Tax=Panicum miliaceum TaxID=4540 RepID=A0A3L6TB75_PANMI|nr:hypothetical protein C2845_PM03G29830 [Panicum miliaceum]